MNPDPRHPGNGSGSWKIILILTDLDPQHCIQHLNRSQFPSHRTFNYSPLFSHIWHLNHSTASLHHLNHSPLSSLTTSQPFPSLHAYVKNFSHLLHCSHKAFQRFTTVFTYDISTTHHSFHQGYLKRSPLYLQTTSQPFHQSFYIRHLSHSPFSSYTATYNISTIHQSIHIWHLIHRWDLNHAPPLHHRSL
jgi:hypothetical protein